MDRDMTLPEKHGLTVLYEDNHLLVVEKPVNIPVQSDLSGDEDLCSKCKAYLKEEGNKPGEAYLGLVHRLDRPVGGVMVFAKTSKAAARLTEQFKGHGAGKRYVAIVCGEAPSADYLTDTLLKDEKTNTTSVVPPETPGGKIAKLSYEKIGSGGGTSLLDITLYTGRSHQIRVQLSHAGLPILGDQRYHPDAVAASRGEGKPLKRTQICLWAYALTLTHPTLGEKMTFFSVPRGKEWERYPAQMELLPAFRCCSGLWSDRELLAVDKRAGVETEELASELGGILPEVYPVHRLDANTRGVLLLAKTEESREALEKAFRDHTIEKTYLAVVAGTPEPRQGHLKHFAKKDPEKALMTLCGEKEPGALRMELDYRVLRERNGCSLVEIGLQTGRTHQIRVQMAAVGHPVLGDDKYGDREKNRQYRQKTQMLLCKRMRVNGMTFESCKELEIPT